MQISHWAINKVLLVQEGKNKSNCRKHNPTVLQVKRSATYLQYIQKVFVRVTKPSVANMVFKYISKEGNL